MKPVSSAFQLMVPAFCYVITTNNQRQFALATDHGHWRLVVAIVNVILGKQSLLYLSTDKYPALSVMSIIQ